MIEVVADPLCTSKLLRDISQTRVAFDPANKLHQEDLATYLTTGRWIGAYQVEMPYTTVPDTVINKFARWALTNSLPNTTAAQELSK